MGGERERFKKAKKSHNIIGRLIKLLVTVERQTLMLVGRNGVDNGGLTRSESMENETKEQQLHVQSPCMGCVRHP